MVYKKKSWSNRIYIIMWMTVLLSIVAALLNMNFITSDAKTFLIERVIFPSIIQFIMLSVIGVLLKKNVKGIDYYLLLGSVGVVVILSYVHSGIVDIMLMMFMLPIFIAVFFVDKKMLAFSFWTSILAFLAMRILVPAFHTIDLVKTISFITILFAAYLLSREMDNRFKIIYDELIISIDKEKELFYKNIYMEDLSKKDLVTQLYNHKSFHEYLEMLLALNEKEPFDLYLALLDLDNFKSVNDTYGHARGDVVIKKTAEFILKHLEANDFGARYGGEEFAVLLIGKTEEKCLEILETIRLALQNNLFDEMPGRVITTSIGYIKMRSGLSKDELFELADKNLYCAKRDGKNRICGN